MKILSIEVGSDITHVVETDYQMRNPKIYNYFSFDTPVGTAGDSGVECNEDFKKTLLAKLEEHKIKTRKTVFSVSSGKIANREIIIPMVKNKRIQSLLNANSSEYFPVDLSMHQFVYRTVAAPDLEKEKKRKLFVLAVPNELVDGYKALSKFCGLELTDLDYIGNSIFQTMHKSERNRLCLTVNLAEDSTLLTIIHGGEVLLQRTIFYGYGAAVKLVKDSPLYDGSVSPLEYMETHKCLKSHLNGPSQDADEQKAELKNNVTDELRPMIANIGRILDYFRARNEGLELEECLMGGNGARINGLDWLLSMELNLKAQPFVTSRLDAVGVNVQVPISEYIACYGAAIAPMKFDLSDNELSVDEKQKGEQAMMVARVTLLVCILASVVMVVYGGVTNHIGHKKVIELQDKKASLAYIEEIYQNYQNTCNRYKDVTALDRNATRTSSGMADAIDEMEQKLPSSVKVTSLSADGETMTVTAEVSTKDEAAKMIQQLESFDIFSSVTTTGINEVTDEAGSTTVEFTVSCQYTTPDAQFADETATETGTETTDQSAGASTETQTDAASEGGAQ